MPVSQYRLIHTSSRCRDVDWLISGSRIRHHHSRSAEGRCSTKEIPRTAFLEPKIFFHLPSLLIVIQYGVGVTEASCGLSVCGVQTMIRESNSCQEITAIIFYMIVV